MQGRLLNWSRKHYYATKTWNLWFFLQFFESFLRKYIYNIFHRKWRMDWVWDSNNITCDYVVSWAFHKLTCRQNKCTYPKKQTTLYSFHFSLTIKDTEIFLKLLFWSDSWVTAPVFHNRFLIFNLYLTTVVIH